jgi:hypothetical protein
LARQGGVTGLTEGPRSLKIGDDSFLSWGFLGSMFVGAITAAGVLFFIPQETTITVQAANGATVAQTSYNLVKLIALSLIVGASGPTILSAMTSKLKDTIANATITGESQKQMEAIRTATKANIVNYTNKIIQDANNLSMNNKAFQPQISMDAKDQFSNHLYDFDEKIGGIRQDEIELHKGIDDDINKAIQAVNDAARHYYN